MYNLWHCKNGEDWIRISLRCQEDFFAYLTTLQSVIKRPAHIVVEHTSMDEFEKVLVMLFMPQVFLLKEGKLYGGQTATRKHMCKPKPSNYIFGRQIIDGGQLEFDRKN
jgi:hypothetical protein